MPVSNLTTITAGVVAKFKVMRDHQETYRVREKSRAVIVFALHSVGLEHYQREDKVAI